MLTRAEFGMARPKPILGGRIRSRPDKTGRDQQKSGTPSAELRVGKARPSEQGRAGGPWQHYFRTITK